MLTLDAIQVGQQAVMKGFGGAATGFRHKLLAMGLTPGVLIKVVRIAPLGDPIQILLRGYTLSLRKKECQQIEVEYAHNQQEKNISRSVLADSTCRES